MKKVLFINGTDVNSVFNHLDDLMCARGAWNRGVAAYAFELLEDLCSCYDSDSVQTGRGFLLALLDGARNWSEFSYGGCALCCDGDIAKRLCNKTELKKTCNGSKAPNSRENWLDVQARALYQASELLYNLFFN